VLLHEKPFAGVNGSGKHNNWSISSGGENLLDPGTDPEDNLRFLAVLASVLLAVKRYGGLLRASVATYGNDFRLGANEAPPAIMSVFLGEQLSRICDAIAQDSDLPGSATQAMLELGVSSLPQVAKDNTDRNRTSPVAFTGNKFEFRAVGSAQSIAGPLVALNTIVAESLDYIATELEKATGGDTAQLPPAVEKLLQQIVSEHKAVIFNGNGYSQEWHAEAAKRGLPNHRATPEALDQLVAPKNLEMFEKYGVLSKREMQSRYEIYMERYCKDINTEAQSAIQIAKTMILPAAYRYQGELVGTAHKLKEIGKTVHMGTLDKLTTLVGEFEAGIGALEKVAGHHGGGDIAAEVAHFHGKVIPAMVSLRETADQIESILPDDLWPLPTYREMLFIK
jgi:glutamine synthetase